MTDETTGAKLPVRDRSGTAEALAKPLTGEERALELPCWARHPAAGGQCPRAATTMVYGLLFCEIHGAEAAAGALAELFQDADDVLERLDNPHAPHPNQEAANALEAARRMLERRRDEHEEDEAALRRAYPVIPEKVCAETVAFDYRFGPGNEYGPGEQPTEVYQDARRLLCNQMRVAYEEGADWLVEVLEYEREAAAAQLAFALVDYERKTGSRYMGEPRPRRDPTAEALRRINGALSEASDLLSEGVPVEVFEDEEDYWTANRAIARAGSIVVRAHGRRERSGGDRPAG